MIRLINKFQIEWNKKLLVRLASLLGTSLVVEIRLRLLVASFPLEWRIVVLVLERLVALVHASLEQPSCCVLVVDGLGFRWETRWQLLVVERVEIALVVVVLVDACIYELVRTYEQRRTIYDHVQVLPIEWERFRVQWGKLTSGIHRPCRRWWKSTLSTWTKWWIQWNAIKRVVHAFFKNLKEKLIKITNTNNFFKKSIHASSSNQSAKGKEEQNGSWNPHFTKQPPNGECSLQQWNQNDCALWFSNHAFMCLSWFFNVGHLNKKMFEKID